MRAECSQEAAAHSDIVVATITEELSALREELDTKAALCKRWCPHLGPVSTQHFIWIYVIKELIIVPQIFWLTSCNNLLQCLLSYTLLRAIFKYFWLTNSIYILLSRHGVVVVVLMLDLISYRAEQQRNQALQNAEKLKEAFKDYKATISNKLQRVNLI